MVIFTLLPESNPTNLWMNDNQIFQDEKKIRLLIEQLEIQYNLLNIEDYEGFYDSLNVQNFLSDFEITADYYPNPVFRLIAKYLSALQDFRTNSIEDKNEDYHIHKQPIQNHTFSEIAERKLQSASETFLLISYQAHNLGSNFEVKKNTETVMINCVPNYKVLHQWLSTNRSIIRNFQITDKHGENRKETKTWSGEKANPLKCSKKQACLMLQSAVGSTKKELFAYDENHQEYIVFKYEGNNPQNRYHGYHIPQSSREIPKELKQLILQIKQPV